MKIQFQFFGALRGLENNDLLSLDISGACIEDARSALVAYAEQHWSAESISLLPNCAFASSTSLLRGQMPVPEDGCLVVLPPVNGG
jgi:hypothetical protein